MSVFRHLLVLLVCCAGMPLSAQGDAAPRTVSIADSYGVGEFALDVPPDWAVDSRGTGALTLAGPRNVLAVLLLVPRPVLPEYDIAANAPLTGVFAGFAAEGTDAPQGRTVAGLPALVGTQPGVNGGAVALTVTVEQGDFVWVLLADADGAPLGAAVDTLLAILDTARYRYYGVQLPQVATAPDATNSGTIVLRYPAGWVAEAGAAGVNLGNSQRALDNVNLEFVPLDGQVVGTVTVFPDRYLGQLGINPAAATPVQVWDAARDFLVGPNIGAQLGDAEPVTVGGRDAAVLSFQLREPEGTIESRVIVIDAGDAYALMVFTAAEGGIAGFDPALFAIADALRYTPDTQARPPDASAGATPESTPEPDAPQTLSVPVGRGGVLALTVPPLWVLRDAGGAILFANRAATVNGMTDGYPESGQVAGYAGVIPRQSLDVYGLAADAEPAAVLAAFLAQTAVEGVTADLAPTERTTFGSSDGALITGTQTDGENVFDVAYFAVDAGDGVVVFNVIAPANSMATYLEALRAVVASADYSGGE